MIYPHRVAQVLVALGDGEWRLFYELHSYSGPLDSKQITGTLVWLRNRGIVESRLYTTVGPLQWRLNPRLVEVK